VSRESNWKVVVGAAALVSELYHEHIKRFSASRGEAVSRGDKTVKRRRNQECARL
jgi:hypothetical protein